MPPQGPAEATVLYFSPVVKNWDNVTLNLDPAVVTDKVRKYTGCQLAAFSLNQRERDGIMVQAIQVGAAQYPLVFTSPGTYELPDKKQARAFSVGQVYFRHGTKSEPGNTDDLRGFVDREVSRIREEWLGNIRKVVEAPVGSVISVAAVAIDSHDAAAIPARLVHAPDATAVAWRSPDDTHPFREKEAIVEINRRIHGRGRINAFDILLVRRYLKMKDDPNLVYKPKFGSCQYSTAFVDWLAGEFEKDDQFFHRLRGLKRDQSDESLQSER